MAHAQATRRYTQFTSAVVNANVSAGVIVAVSTVPTAGISMTVEASVIAALSQVPYPALTGGTVSRMYAVTASADDADELHNDTGFSSASGTVRFISNTAAASRRTGGCRFQNIQIPKSSGVYTTAVTSAKLLVTPFSTSVDDANCNLYCEAADNSVDFSTNADVQSRSRTTANTSWVTDSLGASEVQSPSFHTAVQEVIDRSGWASGNALTVLGVGKSDVNKNLSFWSYDGIPTLQRFLVEHTVSANITSPTIACTTTVPAPTVTFDGTATPSAIAAISTVPAAGLSAELTASVIAGIATVPTPDVAADSDTSYFTATATSGSIESNDSVGSDWTNVYAGTGTSLIAQTNQNSGGVGQNYVSATSRTAYETFLSFDTSTVVGATGPVTLTLTASLMDIANDFTLRVAVFNFGTLTSADWRTPTQLAALTVVGSIPQASILGVNISFDIDIDPSVLSTTTQLIVYTDNLANATAPTDDEWLFLYGPANGTPANRPKLTVVDAPNANVSPDVIAATATVPLPSVQGNRLALRLAPSSFLPMA